MKTSKEYTRAYRERLKDGIELPTCSFCDAVMKSSKNRLREVTCIETGNKYVGCCSHCYPKKTVEGHLWNSEKQRAFRERQKMRKTRTLCQ